jgi:hypothetical protein
MPEIAKITMAAKIKCDSCNKNSFDYYMNLQNPDEKIKCPYCHKVVKNQSTRKFINSMANFINNL